MNSTEKITWKNALAWAGKKGTQFSTGELAKGLKIERQRAIAFVAVLSNKGKIKRIYSKFGQDGSNVWEVV